MRVEGKIVGDRYGAGSSMLVLIARVALIRLASTLLVACSDPGLVAAHAAFQCLVRLDVARHAVDDVLRFELADIVCDG